MLGIAFAELPILRSAAFKYKRTLFEKRLPFRYLLPRSSGQTSRVNTELTDPSQLGIIYQAEPSNTEPSLKEYHFCPNISYFILKCILYTLIAILLFSNHSLTSIRGKVSLQKSFFHHFLAKDGFVH